jgi:RimJ/RimL family protein N-acetyltransferase
VDNTKERSVVFLEGKKVILRPLDKRTDAGNMQHWINDPVVRLNLAMIFPQTLKNEEDFIDCCGDTTKGIVLAITIKETGEFIGVMGLHDIDWPNRNATTGALIGEKKYWGRGYGTDAKMILLNYAFNTLNLHTVSSSAIAFNKRSIGYNTHCGYKVEGVCRSRIFRSGRYWDRVMLSVMKKDWLPIWRQYQKTGLVR